MTFRFFQNTGSATVIFDKTLIMIKTSISRISKFWHHSGVGNDFFSGICLFRERETQWILPGRKRRVVPSNHLFWRTKASFVADAASEQKTSLCRSKAMFRATFIFSQSEPHGFAAWRFPFHWKNDFVRSGPVG